MSGMRHSAMTIAVAAGFCVSAGSAWADGPQVKDPATAKVFIRELVQPTPLGPETQKRVPALIADLGNDRWRIRDGAFEALLRIGPKAAPIVTEALSSADPERSTRAELLLGAYRASQEDRAEKLSGAVDLLAAAEDKSAIDALIRLLRHKDVDLRCAAEYGLRRLTGRQFGYNAYCDKADRDAAAGRWRAWWKDDRRRFGFRAGPPEIAGVLACDSSAREVFVVSLTGKTLWTRTFTERPFAADVAPNGNVLVSFHDKGKPGITEYTRGGKIVWSETLAVRGPLLSVQRLANGNTLGSDWMGRRIAELGPKGKGVVWQYAYIGPGCSAGAASAQRLANGNTLVSLFTGTVVEVNRAGKVVWRNDNVTRPRDARKLANGNVLITEHGRHRVVEITRAGKEVWAWTDPEDYPLSACRLPDGRTAIHTQRNGLLLVDRSGKVIRTLSDRRPYWSAKLRLVPATFLSAKTENTRQN